MPKFRTGKGVEGEGEVKLGKMPLRKRIAEIRERVEPESEAILSEEEIKQFNEEL